MKKLIFILLLLPVLCNAQIELGVNGGIAPFTVSDLKGVSPGIGNDFDFSASYHVGSIKFGIGYSIAVLPLSDGAYWAKPFDVFYASVDKYLHKEKKSDLYIGLKIGAATFKDNSGNYIADGGGSGFMAGLHLAFDHKIYKALWFNIQAEANYSSITTNGTSYVDPSTKSTFFYFPITVGIHYRIPIIKHKK